MFEEVQESIDESSSVSHSSFCMSTVPKKQQEKQQITAAPDIFLSLQTSTKSIKNLPTITKGIL